MMKIVKKSLSSVAQVWCDIQNYLASKNQLDEHNLDFNCQRLEPRQLLSATPVGGEFPVENDINQTQIQAPLSSAIDSYDIEYSKNIVPFESVETKIEQCAGYSHSFGERIKNSPLGMPADVTFHSCDNRETLERIMRQEMMHSLEIMGMHEVTHER